MDLLHLHIIAGSHHDHEVTKMTRRCFNLCQNEVLERYF